VKHEGFLLIGGNYADGVLVKSILEIIADLGRRFSKTDTVHLAERCDAALAGVALSYLAADVCRSPGFGSILCLTGASHAFVLMREPDELLFYDLSPETQNDEPKSIAGERAGALWEELVGGRMTWHDANLAMNVERKKELTTPPQPQPSLQVEVDNRIELLRERNRDLWDFIGRVEMKLGGAVKEVGLRPDLERIRKGHAADEADITTALGRAYKHLAVGTNVPIDEAVESLVTRLERYREQEKTCRLNMKDVLAQGQNDRTHVLAEVAKALGAEPNVDPATIPGLVKAWKAVTRNRMERAEEKWQGLQGAWERVIAAIGAEGSSPGDVAELIEAKAARWG